MFAENTEIIAILNLNEEILTFADVVEKSVQQLEGTFAIVVKSKLFPNELVAARRGLTLCYIVITLIFKD